MADGSKFLLDITKKTKDGWSTSCVMISIYLRERDKTRKRKREFKKEGKATWNAAET